ncbi:Kinase, NEK [Giardia duodenalis]|uniref:Kinase, NEK n=1 Tax=Giardia intestinalis (strain ATCC 50803 / WB clone C6) TaxID=184922 RepID=A8BRF6_GIAIC|nr:Kinase, NEK [Giardia intestinalis]KAE8306012.1 Kinase, NEK [Giardia intestinalis]|eukprot:XP_001705254.1 Kinase, NEK [Giardia lamblia ATCC 50803]
MASVSPTSSPLEKPEGEAIVDALGPVLYQGVGASIYAHITRPGKVIKEVSIYGLQEAKLKALRMSFQDLARIHHPNIVHSEFPIEHDGYLYVQMDRYCTSLETMIRTSRLRRLQFSKSQILTIVTQVSAALAYLHSAHKDRESLSAIVHGRVQPANILVNEDGRQFALSNAGVHRSRQKFSNTVYTAPEILLDADLTPAADMWSLGVILYELATKNRPEFISGCMLECGFAEGWVPDLSSVEDVLLNNIIRRLLIFDPISRMSSSELSSILQDSQSLADIENYFRLDILERDVVQLALEISMLHSVIEKRQLLPRSDGLTTLMCAARSGNVDVIKQLIDTGEGVRAQDAAGLTALMHATVKKQYDAIKVLVAFEHGIYDNGGQTALMHAAQMNDPQAIHLLAQYEAGMKTKRLNSLAGISVKSRTALMGAAAQGFTRAVEALLQYEGGLRDELHQTALMYAASQNHLEAVQLLASREGGLQDSMSQTALILAVQRGNVNVVPFLLCEVGMKNNMGYSALMIAANEGQFDIVQLLVEHEKGMRSLTQSTALISAAYNNHSQIVELLIPYESRMQNRHGLTALMEAAKHGYIDVVRILVDHEKGVKDNLGRTARTMALKFGHSEIADFLSQYPEEQCTLL